MYVDDPRPFTAALTTLAAPGGIISLVAKNARCMASCAALEGRWTEALAIFDADRQVNGLEMDTRADTVHRLTALLAEVGAAAMTWYGVRLFTDGWTAVPDVEQPGQPSQPEEAIFAVELEASRRDPYRQLSRLFHLIARHDDSDPPSSEEGDT